LAGRPARGRYAYFAGLSLSLKKSAISGVENGRTTEYIRLINQRLAALLCTVAECSGKPAASFNHVLTMGESIRIPIEDLFDTGGKLPLQSASLMIEKAEIIAISECGTGQHAVIYGLAKMLGQIERNEADTALMLVVEFDENSENLAKLFHLIYEIKGQDDGQK
jgi:hypothetical protein